MGDAALEMFPVNLAAGLSWPVLGGDSCLMNGRADFTFSVGFYLFSDVSFYFYFYA